DARRWIADCEWRGGVAVGIDLLQAPSIAGAVIPGILNGAIGSSIREMLLVIPIARLGAPHPYDGTTYCRGARGLAVDVDPLQAPSIVGGVVPRVPDRTSGVAIRNVLLAMYVEWWGCRDIDARKGIADSGRARRIVTIIELLQIPAIRGSIPEGVMDVAENR